jgi:(E)-4-hydroxy-3-methyl-but-2-enyl pyrophosphate reductase
VRVRLAKTAGFCMGVRRALEMVLSEANKNESSIYTYGPLIHNEQVMRLLESKGVVTLKDLRDVHTGTLVIRAHGIPPQDRKLLKSSGLKLIDATCPKVARVQALIRYHTNKGYTAVIVGDKDHAEVIGLKGHGNGQAHVISTLDDVRQLPDAEKVIVVAQTTQEKQSFDEIVRAVKVRFPEALIFDTICDATRNRQDEVRTIAPHVDAIVVVGGYHSGNTRRLAQVAESTGLPVFYVETEKELDLTRLSSMETVGVTAGASTPNWMIKKVVQKIETVQSKKDTRLGRYARNVSKFFFQSNLVAAFGAFSLSYAGTLLTGRSPDLLHPVLAFLYVYAMHILNRFLDKGASTYNDPERARFYRRYRVPLVLSGLLSIAGALLLAGSFGFPSFLAVAALSLLGAMYSLPIVPISRRHLWRYSKIKDIPGSKTLSQALAWGAVIALLPLLESPSSVAFDSTLVAFFFVFSMVYVRCALFDIFQVQGDLIVGTETLPITLGEKRTLLVLRGVILAGATIVAASPLFGLSGYFSYALILCYVALTLCLVSYEKRWLHPGTSLEALVEGNLFLAGFLGLLWQWLK